MGEDFEAKKFAYKKGEERTRFVAGLWVIWIGRNSKVFEGITIEADQLITRASQFLVSACVAEGDNSSLGRGILGRTEVSHSEEASREIEDNDSSNNLAKEKATLQFDGSWRYSQRLAGGGIIIYDHNGMTLLAKAKNFAWGNRAKEIEALSLEMGLDMATKIGIDSLTIEGDAEILLNEIFGKNRDLMEDRSTIKEIILRIKAKASNFRSIHWNWIEREKNTKAHRLASLGISIEGEELWISDSVKHCFDSTVSNSELLAPVS